MKKWFKRAMSFLCVLGITFLLEGCSDGSKKKITRADLYMFSSIEELQEGFFKATSREKERSEYSGEYYYYEEVLNIKGERVVPPAYFNKIISISEGIATCCDERIRGYKSYKEYGFFDIEAGKKIANPYGYYDNVRDFHEGLAYVEKDWKRGFIDKTGALVFAVNGEAKDFHCGLAKVINGSSEGFIDKTGKIVIPVKNYQVSWGDFGEINENLAFADDVFVTLDKKGNVFYGQDWKNSKRKEFVDGLAVVETRQGAYVINTLGKYIVPSGRYSDIRSFNEGFAAVCKEGKWGYINMAGEEVIPCQYTKASDFHNGWAAVEKSGADQKKVGQNKGYIDITGNLIIPCKYEGTGVFNGNFAPIKAENNWGLVNSEGKIVVPCIYESVTVWENGAASVVKDGKYRFFNLLGELMPEEFDSVSFGGDLVIVEQLWKKGYVDGTGQLIIPCEFDWAGKMEDGFAYVKINGSEWIINRKGKRLDYCPEKGVARTNGYIAVSHAYQICIYDRDGNETCYDI